MSSFQDLPTERTVTLSPDDIKKVHDYIVEHLDGRAAAHELKGKKRLDAQGHFLCGAMAALHIMGLNGNQSMPPKWVFDIMSGTIITNK
jgi:hypothetical protein